jgi:hypothetical protein
VQDASPYLDGYRVTLHIGNPSFASYDGFELTVKWNSKYDWSNFDTSTFDTWQKSERNKELSFTNSLVLGKWNAVELIYLTVHDRAATGLFYDLDEDACCVTCERQVSLSAGLMEPLRISLPAREPSANRCCGTLEC